MAEQPHLIRFFLQLAEDPRAATQVAAAEAAAEAVQPALLAAVATTAAAAEQQATITRPTRIREPEAKAACTVAEEAEAGGVIALREAPAVLEAHTAVTADAVGELLSSPWLETLEQTLLG